MKVQPISYKQIKETLLQDEDTKQLYLTEKRVDELQSLLKEMRTRAGLTVSQVAEKMGVTQPAISKLERNASRASFLTLQRYAQACGSELIVAML
ncbi:helix-turn-helix domain-containing protein [Haemophilus influenzae]|uniref:helix-turn-helix domain-containing protein n=1 Tax=Haemophilus influenzae TaxID=727 RepID=UPI000D0134C9|nr:helix-turn-helix transcriptional regulator [Haemophilus influenzae]MCK9139958.1 helix-turn-helix domain-containing protein [Haemophilus influenzae]PRM16241.1 helix-turn-helix protein [Haemophilus influenzae]